MLTTQDITPQPRWPDEADNAFQCGGAFFPHGDDAAVQRKRAEDAAASQRDRLTAAADSRAARVLASTGATFHDRWAALMGLATLGLHAADMTVAPLPPAVSPAVAEARRAGFAVAYVCAALDRRDATASARLIGYVVRAVSQAIEDGERGAALATALATAQATQAGEQGRAA